MTGRGARIYSDSGTVDLVHFEPLPGLRELKQIPRRTTISTRAPYLSKKKCPNKTFNRQLEEASQPAP